MTDPFKIGFLLVGVPLMVVLNAFIASFVASFFLSERESKIAGFAFVLGLSVSINRMQHQHWIVENTAVVGGLGGFILVWWLYFKREKQHG